MADLTGLEATAALGLLLAVAWAGRAAGRHLRWARAQTRERAAWLTATEPAYQAELDLAAQARALAAAVHAARDVRLGEVARGLRPVGTSVSVLRDRS